MDVPAALEKFRCRREKAVSLVFIRQGQLPRFDPAVQGSAPLEGQLIARQMLGVDGQGAFHRLPPAFGGLPRHPVDEIDGEVVEPGPACRIDGLASLATAVAPPEGRQDRVVEGLHPDAHAVEAGLSKALQARRVDVAGVDLHGDLGSGRDRKRRSEARQDVRQTISRQAGRRSAPHVDRVENRGKTAVELHLEGQSLEVAVDAADIRDRIEIAVGALRAAEGDVYVQPCGRADPVVVHRYLGAGDLGGRAEHRKSGRAAWKESILFSALLHFRTS